MEGKRELELGDLDEDGRVFGRFGVLPGVVNIAEDEFVERVRFPLKIVLVDGKVLIRKDFRGNRVRFLHEWGNLKRLQDKANVPALYCVKEEQVLLYKNLISGRTLRDILVDAGAKILNTHTDNDPELAKLDTQSRLWAILGRGTALLRQCFPESFFTELKCQMDKIHACNVARLSLTFGNIMVDEHGTPWFIDLEGAQAFRSKFHPYYPYYLIQDRHKFQHIYGIS